VYAPVIEEGGADFLLAFELLEAYRNIHCLKPGGRLVTNTQRVPPMPVMTGAATYPEDVVDVLTRAGVAVTALDALALARQAGSAKAVNVALLGALARFLEFTQGQWQAAIAAAVKPAFRETNLRAFQLGYSAHTT
jgi:indolepyruvate ferredoxin oxidoreductase beta subunit